MFGFAACSDDEVCSVRLRCVLQIIVAVAINKERPPLPSDAPPRLASLVLRCWSENPAVRPRVDEVLVELEDMMRVSGGIT